MGPLKFTQVILHYRRIFRRKANGETNLEIAASYGLSKQQIKKLVTRQNRKKRLISAGYVPRPKGRPKANIADEETLRNNELVKLRMQVDLLRNFLLEVGRR